jgi:hypothetical protein
MLTTAPPLTKAESIDAVELLSRLSVADLRARLDALEDHRKGLLVLLRSARARERAAARRQEVRP